MRLVLMILPLYGSLFLYVLTGIVFWSQYGSASRKSCFFFVICSPTTSATIVGTPARRGCTPSSRLSCASRSVDLRSFICFLTIITPTAKLAAKPQKKPESPMNALVSFGCTPTGTNCGAVSIAGVSTTVGMMADDGTAGAAGICNPGDCAGPMATGATTGAVCDP